MLTEEQKKLVEDNYRLAMFAANRSLSSLEIRVTDRIGGYTRDDFYSEAYLALCKAAESYDESKGSFSSYAIVVIKHHIWRLLDVIYRTNSFMKETFSMDAPIQNPTSNKPSNLSFHEMIEDDTTNVEKNFMLNERNKEILTLLKKEAPFITGVITCGNKERYARKIGKSREWVRQRVNKEKRILTRKYHFKELLDNAA